MLKMKKWSFDTLAPVSDSRNESSSMVFTRSADGQVPDRRDEGEECEGDEGGEGRFAPDLRKGDEDSVGDDVDMAGGEGHQGQFAPDREPTERSAAEDSYVDLPALDGKAVEHYQEAKAHYSGTRPPFVSANRQQSDVRKVVVLATSEGKYPKHPQIVTLVTRSRNKFELYWILDLGKQTIVKITAGGSNGATYRSWLGVDKGLSALPVAFSPRGVSKKVLPSKRVRKPAADSLPSSSGKPRERRVPQAKAKKGQPKHRQNHATTPSDPLAKKEKQECRLGLGLRPSYEVQPLDSPLGNSVGYLTVPQRPFPVNSAGIPRTNQSARNLTRVEQDSSESARIAQIRDGQIGGPASLAKETTGTWSESEQPGDAGYIDEGSSDVSSYSPANRTRSKKRKRVIPEGEDLDGSHGATSLSRVKIRAPRTTNTPSASNTRLPTMSTSISETPNARSSRTSLSLHTSHSTCSLPSFKVN